MRNPGAKDKAVFKNKKTTLFWVKRKRKLRRPRRNDPLRKVKSIENVLDG